MNRTDRAFAILVCVGIVSARTGCAQQQKVMVTQMNAVAAMPFHFANIGDKSVGIWERDRLVLVYNVGDIRPSTDPTTRPIAPHSNYIHPIYGLDGEELTDDFPADHVHHRGLYWAWPHVKVGDDPRPVDSWSLRGIEYQPLDLAMEPITSESASLRAQTAWFADGKPVMIEGLHLTVHRSTADAQAVDVELTFTPRDRPVTLRGAEGKSYGGLAMRFGPRKTTVITTPTTRATTPQQDLVVTRLPWADLSGDLGGHGKWSGAAVFVAPDHPDYPPTWMTRNYGMLAVGWPGVTPKTLAPGESVTLRYRIWIHRGSPSAVEINKAYDQYRAEARRESTEPTEPTTVP